MEAIADQPSMLRSADRRAGAGGRSSRRKLTTVKRIDHAVLEKDPELLEDSGLFRLQPSSFEHL